MTLHSQQVAVTNQPTELYPLDADGVELTITTLANVYIGGADVTSSTGFLLVKGETICLSLGPNERRIYGYSASPVTVYVSATKND